MSLSYVSQLPEPGQLVDVRRRRYVVNDVSQSSLPPDILGNTSGGTLSVQHLVTLTSIEDDALGEELHVIWEIEPGATAIEKTPLPQPVGFDEPRRLDTFLNAVRWGAASSADMRAIQAPFRSGVDLEDYQLDPVARAITMPRVNLLIADDVGLGKTIEAGLVAQELIIRHRARRILVICPAALQVQWHDQMRDKFGLEFRIVDSELMRMLRRERGLHVNPWTHFPRLITSIDFLKRERPMRLFSEILPAEGESLYPRKFDLLILDEAHNAAPSGRGKYATDSQRTLALRRLAPHFEHKLFLSATPHNGYRESFSALLELLDNQRFARGVEPDHEQLNAIMVRRLKSELPRKWDGSPRFPVRKIEAITVEYTQQERDIHQLLQQYSHSRLKQAADASEPLIIRHQDQLIWREPPVILDAKYYLEGSDPEQTHGPIKKLLGDMTLLGAEVGMLFFPRLPEPTDNATMTRMIHKSRERYTPQGETTQQVHLYHLEPSMPLSQVQQRLRAVLDLATQHLPERSEPVCEGTWLDPDTVHAGRRLLPSHTILCPKRHIGPNIADLVNVDSDCLKNPLLCHVMDQPIVPPFVVRVTTQEQLVHRSNDLRTRSEEQLQQAEANGNEIRAESMRQQIFTGIGRAVEQYVKLFANTSAIENMFEAWIFGEHWKKHARCLDEHARNVLISGEFVWQNYQETILYDWAAPAIQYCRALEHEIHRRFDQPFRNQYHLTRSGFTLGTIPFAYNNRSRDENAAHNWNLFIELVKKSGSNDAEFITLVERINGEQVLTYRNLLAHGGIVNRVTAASLRDSIIGDKYTPGILCWLVDHVDPV